MKKVFYVHKYSNYEGEEYAYLYFAFTETKEKALEIIKEKSECILIGLLDLKELDTSLDFFCMFDY